MALCHRASFRSPILLIALLLHFATHVAGQGSCYYDSGSEPVKQPSSKWVPCNNSAMTSGGALSCCYVGSECGEDSICHFPAPQDEAKAWFIGGCTDPTWQDPVCSMHCTSYTHTEIQYDARIGLWSCCGNHECTGNVTQETFSAISPQKWTAARQRAASTASTMSPSTSTATAGPNNTGISSNNGSSLSTGDIAGIVVACVVVGLAILIALGTALYIRRRRDAARIQRSDSSEHMTGAGHGASRDMDDHPPVEADGMEVSTVVEKGDDTRVEAAGVPLAELEDHRRAGSAEESVKAHTDTTTEPNTAPSTRPTE